MIRFASSGEGDAAIQRIDSCINFLNKYTKEIIQLKGKISEALTEGRREELTSELMHFTQSSRIAYEGRFDNAMQYTMMWTNEELTLPDIEYMNEVLTLIETHADVFKGNTYDAVSSIIAKPYKKYVTRLLILKKLEAQKIDSGNIIANPLTALKGCEADMDKMFNAQGITDANAYIVKLEAVKDIIRGYKA